MRNGNRKRALQLYRERFEEPLVYEGEIIQPSTCDVRISEPAKELSNNVTASQIIHTQNVHHHHYLAQKSAEAKETATEKTSVEEALLWLVVILGVAFTFGFLIATLMRG